MISFLLLLVICPLSPLLFSFFKHVTKPTCVVIVTQGFQYAATDPQKNAELLSKFRMGMKRSYSAVSAPVSVGMMIPSCLHISHEIYKASLQRSTIKVI